MNNALTPGTTPQNGLVAESDLMYEPPTNKDSWNLRDAEKSYIDSLINGTEFEHPEDAQGQDPSNGSLDSLEQELTAEDEEQGQEQEPLVEDDHQEEEDPKYARGIQRVVQRELAAKEREQAAEARERAAEARIAELKRYEGLKPTAEIAEMLDNDPIGAFKALGKDVDYVIKMAMAQQLGDKAPQALKDFARGAAEKREIASIRAELAAERQAKAATEYFNTISNGAREYVTKTVGDVKVSKTLPTLSKAAKVDSQYVHDEIMEEIVKEARIKAATDPNGEPITYEEAAKRVETRLARIAKVLGAPQVPGMTRPGETIARKPNVSPPPTKAASKPLPPWQRRSTNIEEDGIQLALRAYEEAEAERKRRR